MYRIREFAEGLGAVFTGALCLLVGILAGTLVTMQLSSGTPYSQVDLDRVTNRAEVTKALPARTKAETRQAGRLSDLAGRNERLAGELAYARTTIADLRGQLAAAASAAASPSVSPSTPASSAPDPAPGGPSVAAAPGSASTAGSGTSSGTNSGTSGDGPEATGRRVTGTIGVTWILSSALKPWPASCAQVAQSYRVRVNAGDHSTVTLGMPDGARSVRRTNKGGLLTLTCDVRWAATIPAPVSGVYEFVAVTTDAPEKPLDTALVQAGELRSGTGPRLSSTFCPECADRG